MMKKWFVYNSVLLLLTASASAFGQSKVGYIAFNEVAQLMPEAKTIQVQMDTYQKQWTAQLETINNEYNSKLKEYQASEKSMTDAVRTTKQAELQGIQKRFNDLNNNAQQAVEAKSAELTKPLIDKVKAAVKTVAKEKGFTYIFNSNETELLVFPEADNIMTAVKTKLGLK